MRQHAAELAEPRLDLAAARRPGFQEAEAVDRDHRVVGALPRHDRRHVEHAAVVERQDRLRRGALPDPQALGELRQDRADLRDDARRRLADHRAGIEVAVAVDVLPDADAVAELDDLAVLEHHVHRRRNEDLLHRTPVAGEARGRARVAPRDLAEHRGAAVVTDAERQRGRDQVAGERARQREDVAPGRETGDREGAVVRRDAAQAGGLDRPVGVRERRLARDRVSAVPLRRRRAERAGVARSDVLLRDDQARHACRRCARAAVATPSAAAPGEQRQDQQDRRQDQRDHSYPRAVLQHRFVLPQRRL